MLFCSIYLSLGMFGAEKPNKSDSKQVKKTIITGERFIFNPVKNFAIYEGDVVVIDPQMDLLCNKLTIYFDSKKKPYLKYLILNFNNITKDRKIMKSFDLDMDDVPAIYLYNEVTKEAKKFQLKKFELERQCDMLERLLIFIANGDCGFLSYLNFLHDPYYGMRFSYSGEKKIWQPDLIKGRTPLPPGTGMCSLINIENVPEYYKCKKEQL